VTSYEFSSTYEIRIASGARCAMIAPDLGWDKNDSKSRLAIHGRTTNLRGLVLASIETKCCDQVLIF
jgi:hypothetical protein